MEMREHINVIKRSWLFILIFSVAVAAVAGLVANQRPATYKTIMSYEIQLANRTTTPDYQYGSYYDLKGAEIFTQHAMGLLSSPAVIEEIYQQAGVPYTIDNLSQFTSQFRTDQASAQLFNVTFSRYTESEAEKLASAMTMVLAEHITSAQQDKDGTSLFQLRPTTPVVIYQEVSAVLLAIVGLIVGKLVAIIMVYLRKYLTSPVHPAHTSAVSN